MAWPKGVKRGPRTPMSPLAEGMEKMVVAETFKNFPGDPHPLLKPEVVAQQKESFAKKTTGKPKWVMKAGSNWDNAVSTEENADQFNIPRADFPEGMDMQWVTETVFGQDVGRLAKFTRGGWTPVHATDFDGRFADRGWGTGDYLKKDGMVLCARPIEISNAAKARQVKAAKEQLALKAQAFAGGEINATGAKDPSALATNRISRTIERIDIPTE